MKQKLIIITGPTGVGKSDLAVRLARKMDGEIISADSMQIYRGMDIGSAKISKTEMAGVPHHLLDVADPREEFSVADWRALAEKARSEIQERGHLPIITGGTGLYINAMTYPMSFAETMKSPAIRRRYEELVAEEGNEALHALLKERDPESAALIHPNNVKRVIRALEVGELTGRPFSIYRDEKKLREDLDIFYYWVSMDRQKLYDRIDARVDKMMADGLLEEVRALRAKGLNRSFQSMQGIGYKELLACLDGEVSLEAAIDQIKQGSRNYAKRQMTWFRNDGNCLELSKEKMTDLEMLFRIEEDVSNRSENPRNRKRVKPDGRNYE